MGNVKVFFLRDSQQKKYKIFMNICMNLMCEKSVVFNVCDCLIAVVIHPAACLPGHTDCEGHTVPAQEEDTS